MKHAIVPAMLSVALLAAASACASAAPNPFSNIPELSIAAADKPGYIAEKMDAVYHPQGAIRIVPPEAPYAVPDGWTMIRSVYSGVPVEKYEHKVRDGISVIFLHGGAYVMELNDFYRNWGLHEGDVVNAGTVYMVDYRATGKHQRFPSPVNDAVNAFRALLDAGLDPAKTVIIGDSAGGNLTAALALSIRDAFMPMPAGLIMISPWTDVGTSLPSRDMNFKDDKILGENNRRFGPQIFNPTYAWRLNKQDPLISPVYASLKGLPPMLVIAGGEEMLLDDAAVFAAHAVADGVKAEFKIYAGMSHDWPLFLPELPETKQMERDMRDFVRSLSR